MENPFKPDDKVITKVKGAEVEAVVRLVWNNEVQVRLADGPLVWRTIKTARLAASAAPNEPAPVPAPVVASQSPPAPAEPLQPSEPVPTPAEPMAAVPEAVPSAETQADPADIIAQPADAPQLTACGGDTGVPVKKGNRRKRRK